ncbi:unnamed protein product [Blepharisma stoltei]|uniref:Uncharacterized protein n=1 Tax=Blepharisma stoltei TaxID=1481888 RepID=A0AAU9JRJ5_9CILI|nr:unnamed protein product [Blepharisma stoltei]
MNKKIKQSHAKGLNLARALSNPEIYTNVQPSASKRSPSTWSIDTITPDTTPTSKGPTKPVHILNLQIPVNISPTSKCKSTRTPKVCELNFHKSNRILQKETTTTRNKVTSEYSKTEEILRVKEQNSMLQKTILELMGEIEKTKKESEKMKDDEKRMKELTSLIKKIAKENEELKKKGKIVGKTKRHIEEMMDGFKEQFSKYLSARESEG